MNVDDTSLLAITQVLNRYVHIVDGWAWDELHQVFTHDAVVDHRPVGNLLMSGIEELAAGFAAGMSRHPIAHHLTNSVVETVADDGTAVHVRSKWLIVDQTGVSRSGFYDDDLVLTEDGWRISNRVASLRFEPPSS